MRFLFIGDVVGDVGRKALSHALRQWRDEFAPSVIVVNAENAAGGRGLTVANAMTLFKNGVSVITLGDHAWDQKELSRQFNDYPRILRPFNMPAGIPGFGSVLLPTPEGLVGVLSLLGRVFMRTGPENPFTYGLAEVERLRREGARAILVDFHAEATSEKIALAFHLDGRASAVLGTHTHVPTADARILPGGTACMTDVGMCGCRDGVIGRCVADVLYTQTTGLPTKLHIGKWPAVVNGVLIDVDPETGRATAISPLNLVVDK